MKRNRKKTHFELEVLERELRRFKDGTKQMGKQKAWFISAKLITGFLDDNAGTA